MDLLAGWLSEFSSWLDGHLRWIALALVSTLLVIYGGDVNRLVRRQVAARHFLIRLIVFISLCAFGYGAAISYLTPWLHSFLDSLDGRYLAPVIAFLFIGVGMLAERRNQV